MKDINLPFKDKFLKSIQSWQIYIVWGGVTVERGTTFVN
jgi:hypothetical protein